MTAGQPHTSHIFRLSCSDPNPGFLNSNNRVDDNLSVPEHQQGQDAR